MLVERLRSKPRSFGLIQAVRVLEAHYANRSSSSGARAPIGRSAAPHQEFVRFRVPPSLSFPSATVHALELDDDGGPHVLEVAAFDTAGVCGALPQHYTEKLIARDRRDRASAALLDVFHHRAISFLYRAATKYRLALAYEEARRTSSDADPAERALRAINGRWRRSTDAVSQPRARHSHARETASASERWIDARWTYFVGLLSRPVPTAEGLASMLREALGWPVRIEPFRGRWLSLSASQRTRLRGPRRGGGDLERLGRGAMLGSRAWDRQGSFTARIGPLDYASYERLLPGEPLRRDIENWITQVLRGGLECVFVLDLPVAERPALRLGQRRRMNRNAWLSRSGKGDQAAACNEQRLLDPRREDLLCRP